MGGDDLAEVDGHWLLRYKKNDPRAKVRKGDLRLTYNMKEKRRFQTHRILFELHYNTTLGSIKIKRECNHLGCVNPEHWAYYQTLKADEVREITDKIKAGVKQVDIIEEYGVSRGVITHLVRAIRREEQTLGTRKKTKVRWQVRSNPFWLEAVRLDGLARQVAKKRESILQEAQARARKNERSSASTLHQEADDLGRELVALRRQMARFRMKAKTYRTLLNQAEELRSAREAQAETHTKAHGKAQSGEADDEGDAGSRTR